MKITQIEYGESVNMVTGEKWKKSNIIATLDDTDDVDVCRQRLVDKVNEWNKVSNPQIEWGEVPQSPIQKITFRDDEPSPNEKIQSYITTINLCNTLSNLERFRPSVEREKNPELTQAFENRLKQLSNG